jgi:hypothetical protein
VLAKKVSGRLKSRPINGIGRKLKPDGTGFTNYLKRKEEMKSYRNALAALVLTFVFSASAFAGDGAMWTGITPPPPPPPVQADGAMWTGIAAPAPEADTLTEIALNLLQTLIPLL